MISDPVDLSVPAVGDLVVSVYVPGDSGPPTQHATGLHTTYISSEGDFTGPPPICTPRAPPTPGTSCPASRCWRPRIRESSWLSAIPSPTALRPRTTPMPQWPSALAQTVAANAASRIWPWSTKASPATACWATEPASACWLASSGTCSRSPESSTWSFMEAINDIGGGVARRRRRPVTAEEIIAIYKQMIARAHMRGIKVIGATLTPYEGAAYYSEPGEGIRTAVESVDPHHGHARWHGRFRSGHADPEHPREVSSRVQHPRQSASQRCRVQGNGGIDRFVVVRGEGTARKRSSRAWSVRLPGTPNRPRGSYDSAHRAVFEIAQDAGAVEQQGVALFRDG